jgi:hypothetical protein
VRYRDGQQEIRYGDVRLRRGGGHEAQLQRITQIQNRHLTGDDHLTAPLTTSVWKQKDALYRRPPTGTWLSAVRRRLINYAYRKRTSPACIADSKDPATLPTSPSNGSLQ